MRPRILFVVMSAVHRADVVDQLARSLAPHPVLVHHDLSQAPEFALTAPNVLFVPDPKRTGWADFGFVDGIFHSLRYALDHLEFDYLQLLSPTCLPIQPMTRFEAHVAGQDETHYGCIDMRADPDALLWTGYRAFTPFPSFSHRAARWLKNRYFEGTSTTREEAGVSIRTGHATGSGGKMTLMARISRHALVALSHPALGRHIFGKDLPPFVGSVWFGAKRHVVEALVAEFSRPGLRDYFSRLHISEEFLIPTLLKRTGARAGPLNHYINRFDEAHPRWIDDSDFATLRTSNKFFARKFANDPESRIRLRVINELVMSGTALAGQTVRSAKAATRYAEPARPRETAGNSSSPSQATPGSEGRFAMREASPSIWRSSCKS